MSAFLVSEKTMANLAETLCYLMDNNDRLSYYDTKKLCEVLEKKCKGYLSYLVREVGRELFVMNDKALRERYGNDEWWLEDVDKETEYWCFDMGHNLYFKEKFQLLKSLQCYLYQCSEGKVPECDLYKALENLEQQIQTDIVCHLPEYEQANWG